MSRQLPVRVSVAPTNRISALTGRQRRRSATRLRTASAACACWWTTPPWRPRCPWPRRHRRASPSSCTLHRRVAADIACAKTSPYPYVSNSGSESLLCSLSCMSPRQSLLQKCIKLAWRLLPTTRDACQWLEAAKGFRRCCDFCAGVATLGGRGDPLGSASRVFGHAARHRRRRPRLRSPAVVARAALRATGAQGASDPMKTSLSAASC